MPQRRACLAGWGAAWLALALPGFAAEPAGAIALTVRRLGRLPQNAQALPADLAGDQAYLAREPGGWPWLVVRQPLLTNADIVSAQVVPTGSDDADTAPHVIRLTLNLRARQAWGRATRELVEQDIGVFLDEHLQGGITIRSPITSGQFDFRVHGARKAELQRIAAGLMKAPTAPV